MGRFDLFNIQNKTNFLSFKPLISSSLALLILGLELEAQSGASSDVELKVKKQDLQNITWEGSGDVLMPKYKPSNGGGATQIVENLVIINDERGSTAFNGAFDVESKALIYKLNFTKLDVGGFPSSPASRGVHLKSKTKALKMGENGTGTLLIQSRNDPTIYPTIMEIEGKDSQGVSFYGNIINKGWVGSFTLKGHLVGDFYNNGGNNGKKKQEQELKSWEDFTQLTLQEGSLKGSVTLEANDNYWIKDTSGQWKPTQAVTKIELKEGNIQAQGRDYAVQINGKSSYPKDKAPKATIDLSKGSIGGNIEANGGDLTINFGGQATSSSPQAVTLSGLNSSEVGIMGNITSGGKTQQYSNYYDSGNITINFKDSTKTAVIAGNITSHFGSISYNDSRDNPVGISAFFSGKGEIRGKISTIATNGIGHDPKNTIVFKSGGKIQGALFSEIGENTIIFENSQANEANIIHSSITATGEGRNVILSGEYVKKSQQNPQDYQNLQKEEKAPLQLEPSTNPKNSIIISASIIAQELGQNTIGLGEGSKITGDIIASGNGVNGIGLGKDAEILGNIIAIGNGKNHLAVTGDNAKLMGDSVIDTLIFGNRQKNTNGDLPPPPPPATAEDKSFVYQASTLTLGKDSSTHWIGEVDNRANKGGVKITGEKITLHLLGEATTLSTLDFTGKAGASIDLASNLDHKPRRDERFRLLSIGSDAQGGLKGSEGVFRVYLKGNASQRNATLGKKPSESGAGLYGNVYSDRIILTKGDNSTQGIHKIQAVIDPTTDITKVRYDSSGGSEKAGNIAVATIKKETGKQITLQSLPSIQDFDVITMTLKAVETDENGKKQTTNNYTTYFVDSLISQGVSSATADSSLSTLGLNYKLFIANFNSLNKRMGELRNNPHSQGAWARIFNGSQSTTYGLKAQTHYTTIQGGYDYAFGEEAYGYLGVALSYSYGLIKPQKAIDLDGAPQGIRSASTHGFEVALYHTFIQDVLDMSELDSTNWAKGWYNDVIAKFSYLVSDINLERQTSTYNTQNFGVVLSNEVGYRLSFGTSGANAFSLTPQAEVSLGYFNQSDLKQVLGHSFLHGVEEKIINLKTRIGASLGYDFAKLFNHSTLKSAELYLGAYYAYDYVVGGDVVLTSNLNVKTSLTPLESYSQAIVNVGSNLTIADHTRIYFDFEKSFGGQVITDYQVNLGVRYSFGDKSPIAPMEIKSR